MKKVICTFALSFVIFATFSQHVGLGKYRKLFKMSEFTHTAKNSSLVVNIEGFRYEIVGNPDADEFDIKLSRNDTLIMFQRFYMNGVKSEQSFNSVFSKQVKLDTFLKSVFGIKFHKREPYMASLF